MSRVESFHGMNSIVTALAFVLIRAISDLCPILAVQGVALITFRQRLHGTGCVWN